MARGYCRERIVSNTTGLPLANATVTVREVGTTTALAATMYTTRAGATVQPNPITTGADGVAAFYLDVPQDVDFRVQAAGYPDATISGVKAHYDQSDIVSKTGTQTLTNKTLTSPVLNSPELNSPTITGALTLPSPLLLPDGSVSATAWGFTNSPGNGARLISDDKWAFVVGGEDWLRFRSGSVLREMKLGNVDFLTEPTLARAIPLHIQVQTSDPNDLVIGIHSEVTNNATAPFTGTHPTNTPDGAAGTFVFYQSEATAVGAFRALEVHGTRSKSGAGAGVNDSAMGAEMGIHTAASGNASFGTGTAVPKTMGIWLSSYADALMVTQASTAVAADVGLYLSGPLGGGGGGGGFRYPIFYHDTSNVIGFYINAQGHVRTGIDNNAAAVGYGFVGANGLGMYYGGTDLLAWAAGGNEIMKMSADGLGIKRSPTGSVALAVQGNALYTSGAAGTNMLFQFGRTSTDAQMVVAGGAAQFANEATAGDLVIRAESGNDLLIANGADGASVIRIGAASLGFFTTAPTTKKTVTGSKASGAAFASLLTILATNYGLVTDGSSA